MRRLRCAIPAGDEFPGYFDHMERVGLAPGTDVGGYRIIAPLGLGGGGAVYRAADGAGMLVALKILHSHLDADPVARQRLGAEVAALQRIAHPRISRVLDAELDGDQAFIVTDLIDAPSLRDEVRAAGPYLGGELVEFARALFEAVAAVHAAGIVHRDLTPANVLVRADGPVLIDFGIARVGGDTGLTQVGAVAGTPGYVAPEVLGGAHSDAVSDWWSWTAVVGFAALGRAPFGSGTPGEIAARIHAGAVDCAGLDERFAQALRQGLHPERAARLNPQDFLAALEASVQTPTQVVGVERTAVLAPPPPPPGPMPQPAQPLTQELVPAPYQPYPQAQPEPGYAPYNAWQSDQEASQDDPPVHIPRFYLPLLAWFVLTLCAAAVWPGWTLLVTGVVLLIMRFVGETGNYLEQRRREFGPRGSDRVMAFALSPWLLIRGVFGSLPSLSVATSAGFMIWGFGWFAVGREDWVVPAFPGSTGAEAGQQQPWLVGLLLAVAMLIFLICAWYGPGAQLTRRGGRVIARSLRQVALVRPLLIGLCLVSLTGLGWLWMRDTPTNWHPLPQPPQVSQADPSSGTS